MTQTPAPGSAQAAVAMWWNMAPEHRSEFEDWHSHEHFPERMSIPGFLRGTRWADVEGGEGFFVMYELDGYATLTSPGYLARLNAPTPWSTKMMPHHRDMVRSQCRVLASSGGGTGGFALTLRVSPAPGREAQLLAYFTEFAAGFVQQAGGVACHLLRTETPAAAATLEQQIRGGRDAAADWVVVATSYSKDVLSALHQGGFGSTAIEARGARPGSLRGLYRLAHTLSS